MGKLLRRQIPPLLEAVMLIHSERASCPSPTLSVSGSLLSRLTVSFSSSVLLSLSIPVLGGFTQDLHTSHCMI